MPTLLDTGINWQRFGSRNAKSIVHRTTGITVYDRTTGCPCRDFCIMKYLNLGIGKFQSRQLLPVYGTGTSDFGVQEIRDPCCRSCCLILKNSSTANNAVATQYNNSFILIEKHPIFVLVASSQSLLTFYCFKCQREQWQLDTTGV